jgi:hypothetical protein
MISVDAMDHYIGALRRLSESTDSVQYFSARVNTDAIHAFIARNQLVAGFLETDPAMADDVLFGARAFLALEDNLGRYVLEAWSKNCSSLLPWSASSRDGVVRVFDETRVNSRQALEIVTRTAPG